MNTPAPESPAKASGAVPARTASRWTSHPLLFGCLFVLMGYSQLLPFSDSKELALCLLPVLAGIFVTQLVVARLFPQPLKPAILLTLAIICICFFGDWKAQCVRWFLGTKWPELARVAWQMPIWGIIFLALCFWVLRWPGSSLLLQRYLNMLGAVLVVMAGVGILAAPPRPKLPVAGQSRMPLHPGANPPDIYFILTDAYTSAESLQRFWGYDNSPFIEFLTAQGFHVVKNAHGNATFTPNCLSIYLNMNYTPAAVANFSMLSQCAYCTPIIQAAEAPSRLKASGYDIRALSIFATAGQPRYYYYPKVSAPSLANVLWNKTAPGFLHAYRTRAGFADINLKIFSLLPEIAAERGNRPKFVYAHVMMPHPPYLFDKEGHRIRRGLSIGDDNKDLYLGQLIYENRLLTNAISAILKNSKAPPIIIIQGDHGYRSLPEPHRAEEASTILNALYLPGAPKDMIPPGMTPVNTFRLIFNNYFGEHYPYLPDSWPQ